MKNVPAWYVAVASDESGTLVKLPWGKWVDYLTPVRVPACFQPIGKDS